MKSWHPKILAALVWMTAAFSVTAWALKLLPSSTAGATPEPAAEAPRLTQASDIARAFGPAPTAAASAPAAAPVEPELKIVLMGVVANRAEQGVALLAVEGRPARPYRVGSRIEDRYELKRVSARAVELGSLRDARHSLRLELPAPGSSPRPASASAAPVPVPTAPAAAAAANAGAPPAGVATPFPGTPGVAPLSPPGRPRIMRPLAPASDARSG